MNNFAKGFDGKNVKPVLTIREGKEIYSYDSRFKGQDYFNIRQFYVDDDGKLAPGKGLAVPQDKKAELLQALIALTK